MNTPAIKLSPRLQMVADMVRDNKRVVDIGTDHAYLPAYLVASGKCPSAIASDLRQKPLENARETVNESHLSDKIILCLSDGLDAINPTQAEDIVLAGMGGILISELIGRTPWLKDGDKQLILQPMTHAENVREYLCTNGFKIIKECATVEDRHCYVAINAVYVGKVWNKKQSYYYIGELSNCNTASAITYLTTQKARLQKRVNALEGASKLFNEVHCLKEVIADIEGVLVNMK